MNILQEALKIQDDALKEQDKILKEARAKNDAEIKKRDAFRTQVSAFVKKLQEFEGLPLSYYGYYETGGGYRYHTESSTFEIKFESRGYSFGGSTTSKQFCFYESNQRSDKTLRVYIGLAYDSLSLQIEETPSGGLKIDLYRKALLFNEVEKMLNLDDGLVWRHDKDSKVLTRVDETFYSLDSVFKHVKGLLLKIVDIKALKELEEQSARKTILAKHLGLDGTDSIEKTSKSYTNPNGIVFNVKGTEYRVLTKDETSNWYGHLVSKNVFKYGDLGVLSDITGIAYESLKVLHALGQETFEKLIGPALEPREEAFQKAMIKKYSFNQYVIAVDNFFIVDLNKV